MPTGKNVEVLMKSNLKEKIEIAEKRIKELELLIKHWKEQDDQKL